MTCKDCIHFESCKNLYETHGEGLSGDSYVCDFFKDRSRFVELPHAEWVEDEDMYGEPIYRCSNCHERFVLEEGTPADNNTGRGVIEYRFDGRPDDCPLVEVPTPHGRLIDADKLLKEIEENSYRLRSVINSTENGMFLTGIRQAIDKSPTIIEAEVSEE